MKYSKIIRTLLFILSLTDLQSAQVTLSGYVKDSEGNPLSHTKDSAISIVLQVDMTVMGFYNNIQDKKIMTVNTDLADETDLHEFAI